MIDILKVIQDNLIVLKPVLNNTGSVRFWSASYRYVSRSTGQNFDYITPNNENIFATGSTPLEAVTNLLNCKRKPPVIS
jgi:hypothetical protein